MLKALRLAEYEIEIDTEWAWNDFSGLKSNIHSAQVFVSSRIVKNKLKIINGVRLCWKSAILYDLY